MKTIKTISNAALPSLKTALASMIIGLDTETFHIIE